MKARTWIAAALVLSSAAAAYPGCTTRGYNKGEFNVISVEQERQWGAQLKRDVDNELARKGMDYQDARVDGYLDRLGTRLLAHAPEVLFEYTFTPVKNEAVNAFAIPGGNVYINTGLLEEADNEAEVAGVMAHEIGHAVARHGSERLSAIIVATTAGSILVASQEDRMDRLLTELAVQIVTTGSMLAYSRANEREADRIGARIMYEAGYDPQAMVSFFEKLRQEKGEVTKFEQFLSTHPSPENRQELVREYIKDLPPRQEFTTNTEEFKRVQDIVRGIEYPDEK